jgi:hypothetical protein
MQRLKLQGTILPFWLSSVSFCSGLFFFSSSKPTFRKDTPDSDTSLPVAPSQSAGDPARPRAVTMCTCVWIGSTVHTGQVSTVPALYLLKDIVFHGVWDWCAVTRGDGVVL